MQVALWADLGRYCYYTGINYSCAQRKSKMGWSEVARCGLGLRCNKPIRASSPFKSRRACSMADCYYDGGFAWRTLAGAVQDAAK